METTTLSGIESYDYGKWSGLDSDRAAAQQHDFYAMPQSAAGRMSGSRHTQWPQEAIENSAIAKYASAGSDWVSSNDPMLESDQVLFNQPFYSGSEWDQTASVKRNSVRAEQDPASSIWASPNQSGDDADALITNWNQQCCLTESPQQHGGSMAHDLSQSRSSSTESSTIPFQDPFNGSSPPSNDTATNMNYSGAYYAKPSLDPMASAYTHGSTVATNNFAYFRPTSTTPTSSVPGLYGASSGSTNTNSTNTLSWQQPPFVPKGLANLSTPAFSRSRSAPVNFDEHTPTAPYSSNRRFSLLEGTFSTQPEGSPSFDQSVQQQSKNATLDQGSMHEHSERHNASPRRRGSRGSGRGNKQQQRQQQPHRYSLGGGSHKFRTSPPLGEHNNTRRASLGSYPSLTPIHDDGSDQLGSSETIRQLLKPGTTDSSFGTLDTSNRGASRNSFTTTSAHTSSSPSGADSYPILPLQPPPMDDLSSYLYDDITNSYSEEDEALFLIRDLDISEFDPEGDDSFENSNQHGEPGTNKNREWLQRMNRKLQETPVGELDPTILPLSAIMNVWAKTKSAQGASMVEMWLKRVLKEHEAGNQRVVPTPKMFTMAIDAWARSGEGGAAAQRAEALLQQCHELYQSGQHDSLRPSTGMFNAVINSWARSREKLAPMRALQILDWMQNLKDLDVQPDKYTFNTVIHAFAKAGSAEGACQAQELLERMHKLHREGNPLTKPDTITYNVVINACAKTGRKGSADQALKLLEKMHKLYAMGDPDVNPNVVTYGAVVDSFAKSGEPDAASKADQLLARMIHIYQSDPNKNAGLMPNTYIFNTVINCWAKSKDKNAATKAEEMLVAMSQLHASGMPSLKPDAFTYTAVIDAYAKSGLRGAASRASQLLDRMEAKYQAGDVDLKPNTFTYNAVINALAKSGEAGAASMAERVLQLMVNRHRNGGGGEVKPSTINFNTVLDAWAKSGGGRAAAERAEEILEWMDRLHKEGHPEVKPDTITFNAVLDAWARSGDRMASRRAEQILDHMDELYRAGNTGVKPDTYTYNTLINALAKSGTNGAATRAEQVLHIMDQRYRDGDPDIKPNTRTHTSVIDAYAKSGESRAARRAMEIFTGMLSRYDATRDPDIKPNVHTANAVCNACAFSKKEEDRTEALQISFRVFDWLSHQPDMEPDSYTYTILLSVCANLIPREDSMTRFAHARAFFDSCRDTGYVNDYVLRKLRQTVTDDEYLGLVEYRTEPSASSMPQSWTRNVKIDNRSKARRGSNNPNNAAQGSDSWSTRRRGK
ncbi:hypothetical protein MPSEU_000461300 [Mayamaea pseudoterrestris]|nr:hypothetical protein MPSEU_000461300 [Mayamaea pseudoterrestris]